MRSPLFARLIAASTVAVALAAATPAAHASLEPVFDTGTPVQPMDTSSNWPSTAMADGRVVVIWSQADGPGAVLMASVREPGGQWTAPTPLSPAGDISNSEYAVVADNDGNFTAAWKGQPDGGSWGAHARTLLRGSSTWSDDEELTQSGGSMGDLQATPDGRMAFTHSVGGSEDTVYVTLRERNGTDWTTERTIQTVGDPLDAHVAYNASGDAVVAWRLPIGNGDWRIEYVRYDSSADTWSGVQTALADTNEEPQGPLVTLTPDDHATIMWIKANDGMAYVSSETADRTGWTTPEPMSSDPGTMVTLPALASDRDGNVVAVYQRFVYDPDVIAMYSSSRAFTRTRDADTGDWSDPVDLSDGTFGGALDLVVDRNYNIAVSMLSTNTFDTSRLGEGVIANIDTKITLRPDGAEQFGAPIEILHHDFNFIAGVPALALDSDGSAAVTIMRAGSGSDRQPITFIGDGTAPEIEDLSVPSSATTGQPVNVSVDPFDLWSSVDLVAWTFGDGATATGASASHTYSAAGSRQISVTVTDAAGHTATANRSVVVSAPVVPPADDDDEDTVVDDVKPPAKPPVIAAPIIEAKLAGKVVTYNVKLSLKSRQSCAGTVTASFTFGNKRYTSKLKLKKVGGACRATG
nr:PKD domain-containing protein [Baekduia sp.]